LAKLHSRQLHVNIEQSSTQQRLTPFAIAMAARAVSPGGALLRTSKLFSLPSQLPDASSVKLGLNFGSDTQTAPFPTLQSVTSPKTSRARGDWGFKRPLPRKAAANTTTPVVRVKHVDSREQVTDYARAADHALSLEKFRELNLPITMPEARGGASGKSVFEDYADFTAVEPGERTALKGVRWRFQGPWLAGMSGGAFQKYLKSDVRLRRQEFRQYVKQHLADNENNLAAGRALESGGDAQKITADDITDEQVFEYLRKLRHSDSRATLYNLVGDFLDLAPIQGPVEMHTGFDGKPGYHSAKMTNPYARDGPPMTHPSAGISYLRTDAYLDNHPVYGPQQSHPPVKARVVVPRGHHFTKLGVAGFVAEAPGGDNVHNVKGGRSQKVEMFEPKLVGGLKQYVHPTRANILPRGELKVTLEVANKEALLVKQELEGEEHLFGEVSAGLSELRELREHQRDRSFASAFSPAFSKRPLNERNEIMGSSQTYGMDFLNKSKPPSRDGR